MVIKPIYQDIQSETILLVVDKAEIADFRWAIDS